MKAKQLIGLAAIGVGAYMLWKKQQVNNAGNDAQPADAEEVDISDLFDAANTANYTSECGGCQR